MILIKQTELPRKDAWRGFVAADFPFREGWRWVLFGKDNRPSNDVRHPHKSPYGPAEQVVLSMRAGEDLIDTAARIGKVPLDIYVESEEARLEIARYAKALRCDVMVRRIDRRWNAARKLNDNGHSLYWEPLEG